MLELAPYRDVRHLTGSCKLIDGNDEFTAGLRLVEKPLREPTLSGSHLSRRAEISFQDHFQIVPFKGTF
jgi:hypothetical protein